VHASAGFVYDAATTEKTEEHMTFEDDLAPKPKAARKLEELSVEELRERITLLEAEIEASKAMLHQKSSGRAAADALFSKKA
jgi:uncharacterized small protein (DUF1192 family)